MIRTNGYIYYNADDEEPKCIRCLHVDECEYYNHCGPDYGWVFYLREEDENDME